jgi:hypothetical protein
MNPLENLLLQNQPLFLCGVSLISSLLSPPFFEWLKTLVQLMLFT